MAVMMFRETPDGLIAIPQPSHAWLSGQLIRAWGNNEFGPVTPYEDVCLAAEQHDLGWLMWEQSPTRDPETGRPHSFRQLSVAEHTGIWSRGTSMALSLGRYPALLVSLHGTGLYANFDATAAHAGDRAAVREFLSEQQEIQRRLIASLRLDEHLSQFCGDDMIERNRGLVRAADRMSIAICTGLRDLAIRSDRPFEAEAKGVPTAAGETDLRLLAVDGDMTNVVVTPWPFAAPRVRVICEGIDLPPQGFDDEHELRVALRNAKRVVLPTDLRSG
jgi:Protein of unknown function (DUF3891)